MRTLEKILCVSFFWVAGCAAEIAEPSGSTEASLTASDPFRWEEIPVTDPIRPVRAGPYVERANKLRGAVDVGDMPVDIEEMIPTVVRFSDPSPLTPADNVCVECTKR